MESGKFDTVGKPYGSPGRRWPPWAKVAVTLVVLVHAWRDLAGGLGGAAVVAAGAASWPTASRRITRLIDQGYAYRYYAPSRRRRRS